MAIFGSDSKGAKKKAASAAPRHAHARMLKAGREHEVVRAPWFSEKALLMTEKGVYTFSIPDDATKADVAGAVKALFNVAPKKIRIVNTPGKRKALRTRRGEGQRAGRRKAYVYLNAGDTIQFA